MYGILFYRAAQPLPSLPCQETVGPFHVAFNRTELTSWVGNNDTHQYLLSIGPLGPAVTHLTSLPMDYAAQILAQMGGTFAGVLFAPFEERFLLFRDMAGGQPLFFGRDNVGAIIAAGSVNAVVATVPGVVEIVEFPPGSLYDSARGLIQRYSQEPAPTVTGNVASFLTEAVDQIQILSDTPAPVYVPMVPVSTPVGFPEGLKAQSTRIGEDEIPTFTLSYEELVAQAQVAGGSQSTRIEELEGI